GHAVGFTCKHYCISISPNMTGASALLCTRRFSFLLTHWDVSAWHQTDFTHGVPPTRQMLPHLFFAVDTSSRSSGSSPADSDSSGRRLHLRLAAPACAAVPTDQQKRAKALLASRHAPYTVTDS